jgi:hypothetical protein
MNADGTYVFVYSGDIGVGLGVISIQNHILKGADLAGGQYTGLISELPSAGYRVVFDMFVPANLVLVQGGSPQEMPYKRSGITLDLHTDFHNGEPIKLAVPPGNITFMFKRAPDELAPYASGMKVIITPLG